MRRSVAPVRGTAGTRSFPDRDFGDGVPGEFDELVQRRFRQAFNVAVGAILRTIFFRHRGTDAIGLNSFARSCAMSDAPVDIVGRTVEPGYIRLLTVSSARYISVSSRDGGASGRVAAIGTILIAGSLMTFFISAQNSSMSSPGM